MLVVGFDVAFLDVIPGLSVTVESKRVYIALEAWVAAVAVRTGDGGDSLSPVLVLMRISVWRREAT